MSRLVWVSSSHRGRGCWHTDPECSKFKLQSGRKIRKPLDVLGDLRQCQACSGEFTPTKRTGRSLADTLAEMDAEELP